MESRTDNSNDFFGKIFGEKPASQQSAEEYYERGLIKIMALKDKKGAQEDLYKAGELGLSIAYDALKEFFKDQ